MTLSAVGQKKTNFHNPHFLFSVSENVTNRASTPMASTSHTEETDKCQAFNHEPLAFPIAEAARNTSFTSRKTMKKGVNEENNRDKQSVTFSTSPWLNEAVIAQHYLTHIRDKHWIWIKSLRAYTHTHIKVLILLFSSWWLNMSRCGSSSSGTKSYGFSPKDMWTLRGGEKVHLFVYTSICSTDSSLPSTLPSTPACSYDWVTGFYIYLL